MRIFNKIAIIGVGLIGGSIGLAVKKKKLAKEVVGVCRREISAKAAIKNGAVDRATLDYKQGLKGADLVIIASPVGKIVQVAKNVIKQTKGDILITDVGSTKQIIVRQIEKIAPKRVKFVGSHPMAGSEKSSVRFADKDLFENSICIVTETRKTDKLASSTVRNFWKALGAEVRVLSPREHDARIALVSHLPHVAAFALSGICDRQSLEFAANGFKDTTRIASSDPSLWRDIFLTNRKSLLKAIHRYKTELNRIEKCIRDGDSKGLTKILKNAKSIRDSLR